MEVVESCWDYEKEALGIKSPLALRVIVEEFFDSVEIGVVTFCSIVTESIHVLDDEVLGKFISEEIESDVHRYVAASIDTWSLKSFEWLASKKYVDPSTTSRIGKISNDRVRLGFENVLIKC
jgi:hypothetical protein